MTDKSDRRFVLVLGERQGDVDLDEIVQAATAAILEDAEVNPIGSQDSRLPHIIRDSLTKACWADLWHRLNREIERLCFADIGLRDVLKFMSAYADVSVAVEWKSLREIGITETTLLSMDKHQISVWDALEALVFDINMDRPDDKHLCWGLGGNAVQFWAGRAPGSRRPTDGD